MELWLARLEWTQAQHDDVIKTVPVLASKVEAVEGRLGNLEPVLSGMTKKLDTLVEDKTARDARADERKTQKMDVKDWLMVAIGVATLLSAVPAMIQSIAQGLRAMAGS